jgi:hypothetical protein
MDGWMDGCKNTHQIGALNFPTLNTLANFGWMDGWMDVKTPTKSGSPLSNIKYTSKFWMDGWM